MRFRKSLIVAMCVASLGGISVPMAASAEVAIYFNSAPPAARYEASACFIADSCCVSAATRSTFASALALTSVASASFTQTSFALPEMASHFLGDVVGRFGTRDARILTRLLKQVGRDGA